MHSTDNGNGLHLPIDRCYRLSRIYSCRNSAEYYQTTVPHIFTILFRTRLWLARKWLIFSCISFSQLTISERAEESGGDQASNRTTVAVATPTPVSVSSTTNNIGSAVRECAGCGKRITERFLLKALDLYWHEDCLKCGCCDCRLGEVGSTLYTKANLILCKRDYLRLFGTTGYCAACNKVIPAFEMVMRAKSNVYHLECFACQQCNHRFCVGDRFYLCDNKILCEYDYEERLVFANMAYNPSSLAHIRRQVSNLQPAGDSLTGIHHSALLTSPPCYSEKNSTSGVPQRPPSNNHRDDGSSGYGSPDSESFEFSQ